MLTTIAKAGDVLALFTPEQPEWGVREIGLALETPKSNAHQILTSLATIGLLQRTPRSRYRLGWRLLALGENVASSSIHRAGGEVMWSLSRQSGETVQLSVFDGAKTVLVARAPGRSGAGSNRTVGDTLPFHASASGKLLLAHHPDAWQRQMATQGLIPLTPYSVRSVCALEQQLTDIGEGLPSTDIEESRLGMACVASPIRDHHGDVTAALSLVVPSTRFTANRALYIRAIQNAARRVSSLLSEPTASLSEPTVSKVG